MGDRPLHLYIFSRVLLTFFLFLINSEKDTAFKKSWTGCEEAIV